MAIVEAMQGTVEQATEQQMQEAAAQMREQAAQLREQADQLREQLAQQRQQQGGRVMTNEQLRSELRTRIQNDVREALRSGDVRPDQAGALAAEIAERVAEQAARSADLANGRTVRVRRPGQPEVQIELPNTADIIPQRAADMTYAFLFTLVVLVVGLPLSRAWARRMDRRATAASPEMTAQLRQLQQSVEAVAIEVERISEAQRYTAKMLGEGVAQPVEVRHGERIAVG